MESPAIWDEDGDPDLLLTHFGDERLFWNQGDGTFREAPGAAGATDPRWTTSAALFDPDGDGDLDVYAANYLDYSLDAHRDCVSPVREVLAYCHPQEYPGAPDSWFENLGDRRFRARTVPGSDDGKGLGVVVTDLLGDGAPDVHVANDTTPNFLFRTEADAAAGVGFSEEGLASGVAYNEEGLPEAGMGTDWGDLDRDGRMDLVVTNFDFETNTVYRNLGSRLFLDATAAFGVGSESLVELGFGCDLADFDNDGWPDLVVANGHILDNIAEIQSNLRFAQPGQFFRNERGVLRRRPESEGDFARERVGRGLATLDYDRDGDLDLALASNRGPRRAAGEPRRCRKRSFHRVPAGGRRLEPGRRRSDRADRGLRSSPGRGTPDRGQLPGAARSGRLVRAWRGRDRRSGPHRLAIAVRGAPPSPRCRMGVPSQGEAGRGRAPARPASGPCRAAAGPDPPD